MSEKNDAANPEWSAKDFERAKSVESLPDGVVEVFPRTHVGFTEGSSESAGFHPSE
jgi:hypothetical protein